MRAMQDCCAFCDLFFFVVLNNLLVFPFQHKICAGDSFINTVIVDPVPFSCLVAVSSEGFSPSLVTIAKVVTAVFVVTAVCCCYYRVFVVTAVCC